MFKPFFIIILILFLELLSSCQDNMYPNKFLAMKVKPSQQLARDLKKANAKSNKKNIKRLRKEKRQSIRRQKD